VDRGQRDGVLVVGEDIAHLKTECAAREGREGFPHQVLDWKCHFNPPRVSTGSHHHRGRLAGPSRTSTNQIGP